MPTKVAKQAATGPDKDSPRPTLDGSSPTPKPALWKEEVGFQALDRATTERSLVVDTLSDYINEGTTEVARLQRRQTSLATNLAKKVESLFVQVAFLEWRSRARHYAAQRHMKGREEYFEAEVAKMQKREAALIADREEAVDLATSSAAAEEAAIAHGQVLMARVAARWNLRSVGKFLCTWICLVAKRRDIATRLLRTVKQLNNAKLAAALAGWRGHIEGLQHLRSICARLRLRREGLSTKVNLRAWTAGAHRQQRERRVVAAVLGRLQQRCLAATLLVWVGFTHAQQTAFARRQALLKRAQLRMANRLTSRALCQWRARARAAAVTQRKLRQAQGRLMSLNLAMVMTRWCEMVQLAVSARRKEAEAKEAAQAVEARVLAEAQAAEAARVQGAEDEAAKILWVQRRLLNLQAAAAIGRWLKFCAQHRHKRALLTRALKLSLVRCSSVCFSGWVTWATEHKALQRSAKRCMNRLRLLCVVTALDSWAAAASRQRRQQLIVTRAVQRLRLRELQDAIDCWHAARRNRQRLHELQQRSIRLLSERVGGIAIHGWRASAVSQGNLRRRAERAMCVLRMATVACYLRQWTELMAYSRQTQRTVYRAVCTLGRKSQRSALAVWVARTDAATAQRGMLECVCRRLMQGKLARGFNTWHAVTTGGAATARTTAHCVALQLSGTRRGRVFGVWLRCVLEERRMRSLEALAARHHSWAQPFRAWRTHARTSGYTLAQKKMRRVLQMLAMRRQRVVLRQWTVCVRRTARLRRLLLRGDKNCLREGITAWYEWVQRRFMNAHRIAVAASRWQYHTVTACLLAWEFEARATRQRHRTGWKVLQRWLRLVARDVLATWREAVRLAQLQRVESREKMRTTKLDLDQEQQKMQEELAASWASGQRWVSNQLAVESLGRLDTTLRTLRRAPAVMHFDQEQILGKGSRLSALTAIDEAIEALASLLPLILAGGDPVAAAAAAAAAEEGIPPYYSPRIADMSSRSRSVWLEVASPQPEEAESPEPQISEIVTPPSSASKSSSSHSRGRSSRKKKRGGGGSSKNPKSATPSLAARESPGGDAVPGGGVGSMAAGAASTGRGATTRRWKALARWEAEHLSELATLRRNWMAASYSASGLDWAGFFTHLDRDNKGTLGYEEVRRAVRKQGQIHERTWSDDDVRTIFAMMDPHGTGAIDLETFAGFCEAG